jgi:hypothetical protein
MSERYPCIYGLREHCEAIELAFRIVSGEVAKVVEFFTKVKAEPKTEEEKVMAKTFEAISKFLPSLIVRQYSQPVELEFVRIITEFCSKCPHRLAKLKEFETGEWTLMPQPKEGEERE